MWITEVSYKGRTKACIVRIEHENPDKEDTVQSDTGGD